MGLTEEILPSNSVWYTYAFNVALEIVNLQLGNVGGNIYLLAVYNLAGSNLINYAQDPEGAPNYAGSDAPFFAYIRKKWSILGFVPGVIESSSDQGTSESLVVQEAAKNYTLMDLQHLKDPWGRTYLQFAQMTGTIWGVS